MLDLPKYKTKPKPERFLITHVFLLVFLGCLLYLGIYINYWLLQSGVPVLLNWIYVVSIVLILIMDAILCFVKYANYEYVFYTDKLRINANKQKIIYFADIKKYSFEENFLDKKLKTGSIILILRDNKMIKVKNVVNANQIYFYLQKAISSNTV